VTLHAITVVLVGLTAGYLADLAMKRRGHGMAGDVLLGIAGSLAGGALFNVFASAPGREWILTIATAFTGAVVLIVVQRLFWQAPRRPAPRGHRSESGASP
jgi:uncharacterized membrane protein YeaQ/YmgE (transglycosylase-associated protein family)